MCWRLHGCCITPDRGNNCAGAGIIITTPSKCQGREVCANNTPCSHGTTQGYHTGVESCFTAAARVQGLAGSFLRSASKHGNKNVCGAASVGTRHVCMRVCCARSFDLSKGRQPHCCHSLQPKQHTASTTQAVGDKPKRHLEPQPAPMVNCSTRVTPSKHESKPRHPTVNTTTHTAHGRQHIHGTPSCLGIYEAGKTGARLVPHLFSTNPLTTTGHCCCDSCNRQVHAVTPAAVTPQPLQLTGKALETQQLQKQHRPAAPTAPG